MMLGTREPWLQKGGGEAVQHVPPPPAAPPPPPALPLVEADDEFLVMPESLGNALVAFFDAPLFHEAGGLSHGVSLHWCRCTDGSMGCARACAARPDCTPSLRALIAPGLLAAAAHPAPTRHALAAVGVHAFWPAPAGTRSARP